MVGQKIEKRGFLPTCTIGRIIGCNEVNRKVEDAREGKRVCELGYLLSVLSSGLEILVEVRDADTE